MNAWDPRYSCKVGYWPFAPAAAVGDDTGDFDVCSDDGGVFAEIDREIGIFRHKLLASIRTTNDAGDVEFWEGVSRRQYIDIFAFYQYWAPQIPVINVIIVQILSTLISQAAAEWDPNINNRRHRKCSVGLLDGKSSST